MRQPKLIDYILLTVLALIWASAFFNIKIATYSFGPVTIAFLRVLFGSIPVFSINPLTTSAAMSSGREPAKSPFLAGVNGDL